MWKKILLCGLTLLGVYSLNFMLFQDQMNAEGYIDGSPSNEAGTSLKLGDRVHLGGSAMSDDMHTVLGAKDGYLYLLRTNSANSGNLSNYNNALNYANTTYKTQLGTVGSAHFSLSGNAVSLISKAELQNLSLVSSDTLHASIPQISDKWWLSDANTSTNRASYMTKDNSFLGTNTITQTTVTNKTCTTSSASEIGILPINSETQEKVLKDSVLSSQSITVMMSIPYVKRQKYNGTNCTGSVIGTDTTFVGGDSTTQTFNYSYNGTKQTWSIANSDGANFSMFVTQGWRPMNVNDTKSVTLTVGSCYNTRVNNSSLYVGSTTNELNYHSFKLLALNNNGYASAKVTGTSNQQYNRSYCDGQTTPAGSALVRPYLKVALNDVLMRNVTKRSYSANSTLSTTGFPASDNSGEYITLQTSAIDVGLQNGASGVSGNRYEVKKPSSGTTITLPLSFSGPIEGNRYVSAEATDKDGNAVYGVLKAIGSATSDSVEIDFANLLQDGGDSFQITLYLEDAGSKNTAYRSEGTEITVQFQKSTTSLSFTKPETTNIKLGSADVKETIATNNTEIATNGDNAVKYTLSGGISNTGLTIINDPIDPQGFTISIGAGTNPNLPADFTLTAELETTNSTKATATKQIHVFQEMSEFKWIPIKTGSLNTTEAESGKKMGDLEVKNGLPKFTYALTSPSDSGYDATKAKDNGYFTVDQEPKENNQTASVNVNTSLSPGTYYIQCKVTDAYGDVLYTDFAITVGTKEQDFIYTDQSGNELSKTGAKYDAYKETYAPNKAFQLYTSGSPSGSSVSYQLKNSTDVISVDPSGLVTILNASRDSDLGKVIVQATSHDPSGTYSDKTIELPITIEQGTRKIEFAEQPIYVPNGSGSVVPNILSDGKLDNDPNTRIEVDANEDNDIAWTNEGKTIHYSYSGDQGRDILLHVTKQGDRNYKATQADGILHIIGAKENVLTLSTPGKIIYGDHFTIRSTQDDSMSTNVQYTFETDNQVFVSVPQVNGNKAEFDAIGYSGSTEISVKVTRSADGELPLTKTVKIKVLPKPITIEIENKDRLRLEENPSLTYKDFKPQLVTWNGVQDTIDESVIKLSTSAVKYSPIGTYPIIAKNVQKQLNDNYPNYTFTIKDGLLNVKDNGDKNFWDGDDDGCPDLNIEIEDNEGNTILINGDKNEDGIPDYNIDKDGDGIPDLNIDTDKDGKPDLNLVILKEWKPNQCITLNDIQFSSGVNAKAEINVDVDNDSIPDINIDTNGDFKADYNIDSNQDGKTDLNVGPAIKEWQPEQDYEIQDFTYDTMKDLKPVLNIDSDGDGYPDLNIDLDADGKPDINIDTDGDLIPDVDIDSTGDGKPDINVDNDGDGKPDKNLIDITEWNPEHNVSEPFLYDTMKFDPPSDDSDQSNSEVGGSYYPGSNMGGTLGGVMTGDENKNILCWNLLALSMVLFGWIFYDQKQHKRKAN